MAIELIYHFEKVQDRYPVGWNLIPDLSYVHIFLKDAKSLGTTERISFISEFLFALKGNNAIVLDFYGIPLFSKKDILNFLDSRKLPYKIYYDKNILYPFKKCSQISVEFTKKEVFIDFIKKFASYEDNLFIRVLEKESIYTFPDFLLNNEKTYLVNSYKFKTVIFLSINPVDMEVIIKELDTYFINELISDASKKFNLISIRN